MISLSLSAKEALVTWVADLVLETLLSPLSVSMKDRADLDKDVETLLKDADKVIETKDKNVAKATAVLA